MVSKYGPGTLRANFDIKAACRNIAVYRLIVYFFGGMKWRGKYFVDLTPVIFNSVAGMVEWMMLNIHHLSDSLSRRLRYGRTSRLSLVSAEFANCSFVSAGDPSLPTGRIWSIHPRDGVPTVINGGASSYQPQLVRICPEQIRGVPLTAGTSRPRRVSVQGGWMDTLFVCHLSRKSSLVCRPRSSYRTSLSGLPCGLPRGVENVTRHQAICRRSWVYSSPSHRSDSITYF